MDNIVNDIDNMLDAYAYIELMGVGWGVGAGRHWETQQYIERICGVLIGLKIASSLRPLDQEKPPSPSTVQTQFNVYSMYTQRYAFS